MYVEWKNVLSMGKKNALTNVRSWGVRPYLMKDVLSIG
jgi:hypothetical protein